MTKLPEYIFNREFDAPRERVWRAWTEPELLQRWYGPNVETIIHQFELKPGGLWLNEMRWGGHSNFQKVIFQEVVGSEKLVWQHYSNTDAQWNIAINPKMPDWPRILSTTVTFADKGGKTLVGLKQIPFEATDAEIACFANAMRNMDKGWGSGFAILDQVLAE